MTRPMSEEIFGRYKKETDKEFNEYLDAGMRPFAAALACAATLHENEQCIPDELATHIEKLYKEFYKKEQRSKHTQPVSYTHLTLPTIYTV